ncbi:MAG: hypothetical protein KC486_32760, partial [Myxococcales bacterium]|nr:hypothetical protein [Myxococcales bacterium]
PTPDPLGAWMSAGDLAAHLRRRGVDLDLHTALITALAVREELPVWSLDPVWDAIAAHLPIRRFDPDPSPYTR